MIKMPLYRPSTMSDHDRSLKKWIDIFNKTPPYNIYAREEQEKFIRDGIIKTPKKELGFDWEKRNKHWFSGRTFPFQELGQFERKFKPEMQVDCTIQCNYNEDHFVFAFHEDFENKINVSRETDYLENEAGYMRTTKNFRVFSYLQMEVFKKFLVIKRKLSDFMRR